MCIFCDPPPVSESAARPQRGELEWRFTTANLGSSCKTLCLELGRRTCLLDRGTRVGQEEHTQQTTSNRAAAGDRAVRLVSSSSMLKGPSTNLAFLTHVLGSDGEAESDSTEEGRRRAAEIGLRKYKGERRCHVMQSSV